MTTMPWMRKYGDKSSMCATGKRNNKTQHITRQGNDRIAMEMSRKVMCVNTLLL